MGGAFSPEALARAAARRQPCPSAASWYRGCRCAGCFAARRAREKRERRLRKKRGLAPPRTRRVIDGYPHGKSSTYDRGCRCDLCRVAQSERVLDWQRRKGLRPVVQVQQRRGTALSRVLGAELHG